MKCNAIAYVVRRLVSMQSQTQHHSGGAREFLMGWGGLGGLSEIWGTTQSVIKSKH